MTTVPRNFDEEKSSQFEDKVVSVNRCAKVVKGGRNFSFSALVVVGDKKGQVGVGLGKANEVADAIRKGGELARKNLLRIPLKNNTITHSIESAFGGARILMKPAAPGTGLIAGGGMRAVLELAGIKDIVAKSLGSSNSINVVKATMNAIQSLCTKEEILAKRGVN